MRRGSRRTMRSSAKSWPAVQESAAGVGGALKLLESPRSARRYPCRGRDLAEDCHDPRPRTGSASQYRTDWRHRSAPPSRARPHMPKSTGLKPDWRCWIKSMRIRWSPINPIGPFAPTCCGDRTGRRRPPKPSTAQLVSPTTTRSAHSFSNDADAEPRTHPRPR
jgi:hypothetical protein